MKAKKLRTKDLVKLGWPKRAAGLAINVLSTHFKRESAEWREHTLANLLAHPDNFVSDDQWGGVALALGGVPASEA
ncbi:MAG: RtcB family protein, partial [Bacteroidota bacterium]